MRVERQKRGVRVRLFLNRVEARDAARKAIERLLEEKPVNARTRVAVESGLAQPKNSLAIYAQGKRAAVSAEGALCVPQDALEGACRELAAKAHAVPHEASFRVGSDAEGQLAGATFQWWENESSGEDD